MKRDIEPNSNFISPGRQAKEIVNRCANTGLSGPVQTRHVDQLRDQTCQGQDKERTKKKDIGPCGAKKHAPHVPIPRLQQRVLEMEFASKAEFRGWGGGKPSSNRKPTAARTNPRSQRSRE